MGWLVGPILAAFVASFIAVKIFDYVVGSAQSGVVSAARASLFVGTWTAVTARAGMQGLTQKVRKLRQAIGELG